MSDHENEYVPVVPPNPIAVAVPLLPLLQVTLVELAMEAVTVLGSVMIVLVCVTQLELSVTVTVYVPATNPEISSVVALFDQRKVKPAPIAVTETEPLFPPLQETLVVLSTTTDAPPVEVIVTVIVSVHPFWSDTVT